MTADLWSLVLYRPTVDPYDLADAVRQQVRSGDLDYRSRLLIRDSINALAGSPWAHRVDELLAEPSDAKVLHEIQEEEFEKVGFPSLPRRLAMHTKPETIKEYLREVEDSLRNPTEVLIAGAAGLILRGMLQRQTEDIDFIDEVPGPIRENFPLLKRLEERYGLHLGHVQSHYFASGFRDRTTSLAGFGRLRVKVLSPYDIFLSKLFSSRDKDRDDLRMLLPQLEKAAIVDSLKRHCGGFLAAERLRELATRNWFILFGEELPL